MTAHSISVPTPRIARGGKAIYGAPLGILMLEAKFPRIPGDMGNGTTWPFPVLYRVVKGASPERVVLHGAAGLEHLEFQGLMTVPPFSDDPQQARPYFRKLRELRDRIATRHLPGVGMQVLSMGMSHDFAVAIEEGSTCVRVGTGIFGERAKA